MLFRSGVIGWKPAYGAVSLEGVHPLAPSLDTLGFFVRELDDVPPVLRALTGIQLAPSPLRRPVFALCRTEAWNRAEPSTRSAVEAAAAQLAKAGAEIRELELPPGLVDAQMAVMGAEAAVSLRRYAEADLSQKLREFLEAGRAPPCGAADRRAGPLAPG